MRFVPFAAACLSSVLLFALAPSLCSSAQASPFYELPSILVIAKSSNRNQVHYAALVDEACTPAGLSPVRPYWRMLERGPLVTESLSDGEQRLLGLEREEVAGDAVQFTLRGMPARAFTLHTWRASDGRCASSIETTIAGVAARVDSVFVQQKLFGVDYVLLTGWTKDGALVREHVSP